MEGVFPRGEKPTVVTGPDPGTFWSVNPVVDFMFWARKNIGVYVEPGYELTFRGGTTHQGLGVEGGLIPPDPEGDDGGEVPTS
jgi:hypothetical protein